MKTFTPGKEIRRSVTIKSYCRGFPDRTWILGYGAGGLRVWPAGRRSQARLLPWKFIIGQALMFAKMDSPEPRRLEESK